MSVNRKLTIAIAGLVTILTAGVALYWQMRTERALPPVSRGRPVTGQGGGSERPVLWVLSVGVSQYNEPGLSLQFADADARAIAASLQPQAGGALYSEVKTLALTNEQVSRQSVMSGITKFLGQAAPDDVAVIFMAGHGVQDRATGSYYFLTYAATAENLLTEGLRMSDFEEMVRVLQRNVRSVVLMLDTCHAGALRLGTRAVLSADDLAVQVSAAEGLFLLAAAKAGEDSIESTQLGHGAFTYAAIEGLRGPGDMDSNGVVSVSELFAYVARHVPRLTQGRQHPYHKMEGTEVPFAAIAKGEALSPESTVASTPAEDVAKPMLNGIGVMEFSDLRKDAKNDWIGKALRAGLNTELSKVRALRVFSPVLIDRRRTQGTDDLTLARQIGISTVLRGSFVVVGSAIRVDLEIIDAATGMQAPSESVQGEEAEFFDLQKALAFTTLGHLQVEVSQAEGSAIKEETNTSVAAYRLLQQSLGTAQPPARAAGRAEVKKKRAPKGTPLSMIERLLPQAFAAEPASNYKAEVQTFLDEYKQAHEQKNLQRLSVLYVEFTPRQRDALQAYLDNAAELTVELKDVEIERSENDLVISCTRRDSFKDAETGKRQHLEVHLTQLWVREGDKWKIADER